MPLVHFTHPRLSKRAAALSASLLLAGCYDRYVLPPAELAHLEYPPNALAGAATMDPPAEQSRQPYVIRAGDRFHLRTTEGREINGKAIRLAIEGDLLFLRTERGDSLRAKLSEIDAIEARRYSSRKTAALVTPLAVVFTLGTAIAGFVGYSIVFHNERNTLSR